MRSLAFAAVLLCSVAPTEVAAQARAWSIYMYLNGDNSLERHIVTDFLEVASHGVKNDDYVSVMVQLDRSGRYFLDYDAPTTPTTQRFIVSLPLVVEPDRQHAIADPFNGEHHVDMAGVQHLADFIRWGRTSRPGDRTVLLIGAHGSGARGLQVDADLPHFSTGPASASTEDGGRGLLFDETLSTEMDVESFAQALESGLGGDVLDVLGLDACLMATIEVAYAVRKHARYLVASEQEEIEDGWDHTVWSTRLIESQARPSAATPDWLAAQFVESYRRSILRPPVVRNGDNTLAVIRLESIEPLAEALGDLARSIVDNWQLMKGAVRAARGECRTMGRNLIANTVDIACFVARLSAMPESKPIASQLERVSDRLCGPSSGDGCSPESAIANAEIGTQLSHHRGLAIYFPRTSSDAKSRRAVQFRTYADLRRETGLTFLRDHPAWLAFLNLYLSEF